MKKFISTYIIAFLGYICFFMTFVFGTYIVFRSVELDRQIHDGGMGLFYWGFEILDKYYVVHFSVLFVIFLFFILEFINRKKLKPLPKLLDGHDIMEI